VHSHQNAGVRADITINEGNVLVVVDIVPIADYTPGSNFSGKSRLGDAMDQSLGLETVGDQLRHGDESEAMLLGEALELRASRARPILAEDLANDSRWSQTGEASEIDRGFRVSDTL